MDLPTNITKEEMQTILHQFRAKYFPDEDGAFIDQLDEEGLRFVFEVIGEKDETKREKMRNDLEQKVSDANTQKIFLVQNVIQKANKLILQYRESKQQQQDNVDLKQLESNF